MKTFSVQIQETVVKECIVEADNKEEAMEIANASVGIDWEWIETLETEMFEPIEFGPGVNNV